MRRAIGISLGACQNRRFYYEICGHTHFVNTGLIPCPSVKALVTAKGPLPCRHWDAQCNLKAPALSGPGQGPPTDVSHCKAVLRLF